jgi:hypothetical protein
MLDNELVPDGTDRIRESRCTEIGCRRVLLKLFPSKSRGANFCLHNTRAEGIKFLPTLPSLDTLVNRENGHKVNGSERSSLVLVVFQ